MSTSQQYLTLPWAPSTNVYYRKFRNRMVLSLAGEMYKSKVRESWEAQRGQLVTGPVWLTAILIQPNKIRRDLDNFAGKALLDALKGLAYVDDSQVYRMHAEWALHPDGWPVYKNGGEIALAVRTMWRVPKLLTPRKRAALQQ